MPFIPTWAQMRQLRHKTYGKGIFGWWKQGWNEYPELMFAGLHALLGTGVGFWRCYDHYYYGTDIKKYKAEYTVFRSDDPRLAAYKEFYEPNYTQTQK